MIGPQPVVIISSPRIAHALIDKRSATTSDRPPSYMAELVTHGKNLIFTRNCGFILAYRTICETYMMVDAEWKLARGILQRMLSKDAITRYEPIQRAEATQLMFDLLIDQEVSKSFSLCSPKIYTLNLAIFRPYISLFALRRFSHLSWSTLSM